MKKYTKLITLILTVIFILIGAKVYITNKENNTIEKQSHKLDKIVDEILNSETENLDKKERKDLKLKIESDLIKTSDEEEISTINFILGYINALEKENIKAIERFNESIKNFKYVKNTRMKIHCYYELSRMYLYEGKYDESTQAYKKLKDIAIKENKKNLIVKYGLDHSYNLYHIPGGKEKSVKLLEECLEVAKETNYESIEDVYFRLGQVYWNDDRVVEGINTKLEALRIVQGKNIQSKIAYISTDIGVDYLYSKNYNEAIIYLSRVLSYNLDDIYKDAEFKSYALLNLSEANIKAKEYDDAKKSIQMLQKNIIKQKDSLTKEDYITCAYVNRADLETELGNGEEALRLLDIAKSRYEESSKFKFYDFDVKLKEEYGDAHYKLGNYKDALKYHKEAEKIIKEREISYFEEDSNERLYLDYKALGDTPSTIEYLEKNNELRKHLYNDKDKQYSHYLISEFENEKNIKEISKLQEYKDTMGLIFGVLCMITIVITIFTYTIYKKNKEIRRLNKLFKNLSMTDALTKVQNRRSLDDYLSGNWALYNETKMPISFVMIDIDYFKKYNDNYGHPQGDKVLERVATEIRKSCRNSDFVARYGGEEFIIIMLNTERNKCMNMINRIRTNIDNLDIKHEYSEVSDRITLSIGVTTAYVGSSKDYNYYIKKADEALYEAKQCGRDSYVYVS